ncbi:hypothetical protein BDZ89DRAFT_988256 [Hymenopellis radicata]|nr:hypothetical protein BDZ89DRAFT_988256 [Hymenopellis radicata]
MVLRILPSFEYSITRPFGEREPFLVAFSLASFTILTALNAYLVGYDVVAINKADYNASEELPWVSSWQSKDSTCQKHMFKTGDVFRTNISAFPYTIYNIRGNGGMSNGFEYANSHLGSCDVTQTAIQVSRGDRSITLSAAVYCPPPLEFEASTTWMFSNHPVIGTITSDMFGDDTVPRALLEGMTMFGQEAYESIYFGRLGGDASQPIRSVLVEASPNSSEAGTCVRPHVAWTFENAVGQLDLQIVGTIADDTDINSGTLYNLLEVFFHAVRIDLGKWTPDNYIPAAQGLPAEAAQRQAYRDMANSKGMLYVNETTPPRNTPTAEAIIRMQYTCNTLQRKTLGSWFISVLSATLSMFLAAWGLVMTILGCLARRKTMRIDVVHPKRRTVCGMDWKNSSSLLCEKV